MKTIRLTAFVILKIMAITLRLVGAVLWMFAGILLAFSAPVLVACLPFTALSFAPRRRN